jgi:hydroxymethylglutaryl-CoA reductase
MSEQHTSRLPGFYRRTLAERAALVAQWANLTPEESAVLLGVRGLTAATADNMIENAIGIFALPLGVATNFLIDDIDRLVPMVVEEPSVLAAVSNAARLFREGGGFTTQTDPPIMIGQLQVLDVDDLYVAAGAIKANKGRLLALADEVGGSIVRRGGGARDLEVRLISSSAGDMLIVHLLMDVRDAMGANAINTAVEHLAPHIESLTGGRVLLRILSNLSDRRKASAEGMIPASALATPTLTGEQVVTAVVEAGAFAEADPYRAATHNKGIMNGIDAVAIATGNDWRAIEAGAHAYASRDGRYTSLTRFWRDEEGNLRARIELPLAVGTVGGATRVHPAAGVALKILGTASASELAGIIAAVGLAQNFAAVRALATEGIQRGHMRMHARQIALAAGAAPHEIAQVVQRMIREDAIRAERAAAILAEMRG